jgi:predicted signal transduction protein with EAL and GGDEF domain
MLEAMRRPHRIEHKDLEVTVSMGIGIYPDDGTDGETLLRRADVALLRAKLQGRGDYQSFKPQLGVSGADKLPAHARIRSRLPQGRVSKTRSSHRQT